MCGTRRGPRVARKVIPGVSRRGAALVAALLVVLAPLRDDLDLERDAAAQTGTAVASQPEPAQTAAPAAVGVDARVADGSADDGPEGDASSDCACQCLCACGHIPALLVPLRFAVEAAARRADPPARWTSALGDGVIARLFRPPRTALS